MECTDPIDRKEDLLNEIIPDDPNQAYDMYKVIGAITDNGEFFEVQPKFAKNIITGLPVSTDRAWVLWPTNPQPMQVCLM